MVVFTQQRKGIKYSGRSRRKGSQLAEFGPGLLVLFVSTFFPMLLLMAVAVNYGAGYLLNNIQIREAAVSKRDEVESATGNVKKVIPEQWKTSGLGQFANLTEFPQTEVSYVPGQKDSEGRQDMIVRVKTTIKPRPMLANMPFIPGIPGLTSESVFIYENEAVIENPDDANPGS
ncbi:hypothetical protein KF707_02925 [Candidatus Obscuribacterales bacterium]|nr:hypothetical protein [Candidatus Obscuribacterales bacterium]MBX3135162.1 hypothetical protein [Candidatus Obscuribacterales bacterium]MBX3150284.1 hypothetical protein [Candidatus Obscuribacterales bacterium]